MVDRSFEAELERQFADAPVFPDSELFVGRVASALDRGWGMRRLLIGGLGLVGGLIGGAQVLRFDLLERVAALRGPADALLNSSLSRMPIARTVSDLLASGASLDAEVLWMSGALALLAIGLFLTRAFRNV
jgi:hypothetical protein